jgi:hypothetical protein
MVNLTEKDIDKIAFAYEIKTMLVKNLCSNQDMVKMLKMGVQYDYMYKDMNGILIASININKSHCGF